MKRVRFALFILSVFSASGLTIFFRTPIQAKIVSVISSQHSTDGEKPTTQITKKAVLAEATQRQNTTTVTGKVLGIADALQGVLNINVPTIFNSAVDIASSITRGDASVDGTLTANGILTVVGKSILQGPVSLENDLTGKDVDITLTGTSKITAPNLLYSLTAGDGLAVSGTQNITITNTDLGSSQKIIKSIKIGSDTINAGSNTSTVEFKTANGLTVSANTSDNIITFGASGADLNVSGFSNESGAVHLTTSTDVVGIGTTSPDSGKKLHVVGDTKLEGALLVTGIANFSGGVTVTSGIDNLSGGITNAGSITGGTGLTSSGTITFSGMSTGIVHSSFGGVLSSSALNLAGGGNEITGILPSGNGGTGIDGATYLTGDILYASANGALSRLGVGGSGQVLTVAGGLPAWGSSGASSGPCTTCVVKDPGSTQVIAATTSGTTVLSLRPASSPSVDIFNVTDSTGNTKYFRVDKDGNVILGTGTTSTTGNLTVAPANTDYLAIAPVAQGAASFTGSITSEDLTAARTWTFPDSTGTICLTTGNCNGMGSNLGGSGTTNYLAKFSSTYAVQNSLLYDNGSGVGIGTTSPTYSLDVSGNLRALGNTVIGGTFDATGAARLASTLQVSGAASMLSTLNVTGAATLSSTLSVTGNAIFSGNIGIGTTNPSAKITFASGSTTINTAGGDDYLNIAPGGGNFWLKSYGTTALRTELVSYRQLYLAGAYGVATITLDDTNGLNFLNSSTTRFTILTNGNVGIGTTAPVAPLHISAGYGANAAMIVNQTLSGNILTASASGSTKMVLTNGGNLGIGTTNPGGTLSVVSTNVSGANTSSALNLTANSLTTGEGLYATSTSLSAGNLAHIYVNSSAATSNAQTALYVQTAGANTNSSQSTYGGWFENTHTGTSSTNYAGYFTASGGSTNYAMYSANGMNYFNGNVGIGTTNPQQKLEVSGGALRLSQASGSNSIEFYSTTASAVKWYQYISGNDMRFFDTTDRLTLQSGGNVGIGTTAPVAPLHISTGYGSNAAVIVNNTNAGDLLVASASGTNRFTLSNAGALGLGTTSPVGKLTLSGTPDASANYGMLSLGSGNWAGSGNDFASGDADGTYIAINSADATRSYLDFQRVNNTVFKINQSGNVGIANNNPLVALDVTGAQRLSGTLTGVSGLELDTNDSSQITFGVNGSEKMRLTTAGNLGIGSTSPQANLDVTGTASVSSTLTMGGAVQPSNGALTFNYKSGANTWAAGMTLSTVGNLGLGTTAPTAFLDIVNSTITTTNGISGAFNGLTSGNALNITSTSTVLTSGGLGAFDWSPGSATTATGDLLSLNVGANGTIGNIFNVKNAGSSVFAVSQAQITAALPTQFTAAGDVGMAYDLNFTNPTSSFIRSNAPLYIQAGKTYNSSDLTLRTFNSGNLVLDTAGGVTLANGNNWTLPTASSSAWTIQAGLLNFDTNNMRMGIATTGAQATLDVNGTASVSSTLTLGGVLQPSNGPLTFNYKSGANTWAAGLTMNTVGNVGIGTTVPVAKLHVAGSVRFGDVTASSNTITLASVNDSSFATITSAGGLTITGPDQASGTHVNIKTYTNTTDNINFYPGGVLRQTFTGTGLIGIGTSAPTAPFHISTGYGSNAALIVNNLNSGDLFTASAAGTTKVTIDNSGNVGVGTSAPTAQLHTTGTVRLASLGAGTVTSDANGNLSVISDERFKIVQSSFSRGLSDLMKLTPKIYKWNELSGLDQENNYAGFLAQNVQSAIPEAVFAGPTGYLSLQDRPILATAINAIKEQQGMIDLLSGASTSAQLTAAGNIAWKDSVDTRLTNLEALTATQSGGTTVITQQKLAQAGGIHLYASWVSNVWTFLSDIVVKGTAIFEKDVTFISSVVFKGRVTTEDKDAAGKAVIGVGKQDVSIVFHVPYTQEPIVQVTPKDNVQPYFVTGISTQGFTIALKSVATESAQFYWNATAIKDAETVTNEASPSATPVTPTPEPTVSPSPLPSATP